MRADTSEQREAERNQLAKEILLARIRSEQGPNLDNSGGQKSEAWLAFEMAEAMLKEANKRESEK